MFANSKITGSLSRPTLYPFMLLFTLLVSALNTGVSAQTYPEEIVLENGRRFLVGPMNPEDLEQGSYQNWYTPGVEQYTPDTPLLKNLKPLLNDVAIQVFLGTWCGDSRREVPRFMKLLQSLDYPMEQLQFIGVDRRSEFYKQSPNGEHIGKNILRVPTFILLKNGVEIGRIIERPNISLEADLCDLLSCSPKLPDAQGE
ncbi:Thiol-disulfide isomerase or thioredoxin [Robiginitalea myxolifaciens]|uniref:Thiol-disulfide isomerase or thioredoxin n=1 Tax=Robiginitalea myxolifaciens TaxID=400055 RepID=A0A1I6GDC5_9FLAO|nr:thioredoxin family protein [Robiginitalea myxolifaciens]SFR40148.1 Thiol-disulfide isomerase or thioredoxin [Robiginitalea myxolifaciens]